MWLRLVHHCISEQSCLPPSELISDLSTIYNLIPLLVSFNIVSVQDLGSGHIWGWGLIFCVWQDPNIFLNICYNGWHASPELQGWYNGTLFLLLEGVLDHWLSLPLKFLTLGNTFFLIRSSTPNGSLHSAHPEKLIKSRCPPEQLV